MITDDDDDIFINVTKSLSHVTLGAIPKWICYST